MSLLKPIPAEHVPGLRRAPVDAATLAAAAAIVDDVRRNDEEALIRQARRLGDLGEGEPWLLPIEAAHEALQAIDTAARDTLERTADRVRRFAEAQRAALHDGAHPVPGGEAGWTWAPVERAGCYAPGGRYPLPSSVIMTAVVARAAGVQEVVVASPRPAPETLAAAAIAGADAFLAVGGAQAIAAMAYGCGALPACDAIVGPGNRWVTAAKQLVSGAVRIDMLAGPSELVVLADATADPARVAADLLAQAEHDPDAIPILLAIDGVEAAVEQALEQQLEDLPTADTARQALRNGFCVATDRQEGAELCDRLAPEHLALHVADAATLAAGLQHYGAVFIGEDAAEVLGDYGAGPNHVLPTGGTARSEGGLSVASFLRCRTWLRIDRPDEQLLADAERLGLMEGLHGHARSAGMRRSRG